MDIKKQIIYDKDNLKIGVLAVIKLLLDMFANGNVSLVQDKIYGMFVVSGCMLMIDIIVKEAFGGGDIKLMAGVGLYFGVSFTVISTCIGIVVSGIYGIVLLIAKKCEANEHFALAPFLTFGIYAEYIAKVIEKRNEVDNMFTSKTAICIACIVMGVAVLIYHFTSKKHQSQDKKDAENYDRLEPRD